jgi:type III secretion system needle length determinant
MDKIRTFKVGDQSSLKQDGVTLGRPNAESVREFEKILSRDERSNKGECDGEENGENASDASSSEKTGSGTKLADRATFTLGADKKGATALGDDKVDDQAEIDKRKSYVKVTGSVPFGGEVILNSLRLSSEFFQVETAKIQKQAEVIKTLGQEIAEKVLASTAALDAKQEVRIAIKDSILKETEVTISKNEGTLSVNFYTSASESASLLASKQAELKSHLRILQGFNDVEVAVYQEEFSDETSNSSNNGRSRDEYVGDYDTDDDSNGKKNNPQN